MKFVSSLTLAAVLGLGMAAPATAQRNKPAAAPAGPQMSADYRKAAAPVQEAIKVKNWPAATAGLAAADAAAVSPDEKYTNGLFRYQIAKGTNDNPAAAIGLRAMLDSGKVPADLLPAIYAELGQTAYAARQWPQAAALLAQAAQAGSKDPIIYIMGADANFKQKQWAPGFALAEQGIGAQKAAGKPVPADWYQRMFAAAYQANLKPESFKYASEIVRADPTPANWRQLIKVYMDSAMRDGSANLDLFRLMRLNKALDGERDYYEYAALAVERTLYGEAKAVVDEGRASGKLPAASKSVGDLYTQANSKLAGDRAALAASERSAGTAANGRIAANVGDVYLGYSDYAKAIGLYRTALTKGGVDADQVNTRLGIALARSGDTAGARAAFGLVKGPARAEIARFWLLHLDVQAAPPTAAQPA